MLCPLSPGGLLPPSLPLINPIRDPCVFPAAADEGAELVCRILESSRSYEVEPQSMPAGGPIWSLSATETAAGIRC